MPAKIIAQTCPVPECNLLPDHVEQFVKELEAHHRLFAPAFRRPEQARWSQVYLNGIFSIFGGWGVCDACTDPNFPSLFS
jgi:hypothetical protein